MINNFSNLLCSLASKMRMYNQVLIIDTKIKQSCTQLISYPQDAAEILLLDFSGNKKIVPKLESGGEFG